jgi:2-aminoadipate transaminase
MFLWAARPQGLSAMALFNLAVEDKVVFVPGDPFYVRGERPNTLRLNFSCADSATIAVGIERRGGAIRKLMGTTG